MDNTEKRFEIIETAQKHFPNLKIIARSTSWEDSYQLLDLNINNVYREFLDTSLRIGADALSMLGQRRFQISRAVKKFRKHDEDYVKELAELRHEKSDLIGSVKQRIEDLERIMLEDLENVAKDKDLGWYIVTIKEEFRPMIEKEKQ